MLCVPLSTYAGFCRDSHILRGLPFALTYLDDILVYSPTVESHKDHLCQVLLCLQEAGLTLRGRKCCIGVPKVANGDVCILYR